MLQARTDWQWQSHQGQLELRGSGVRHVTPFAVKAGWHAPFTVDEVEQFEFFQQCLSHYFQDQASVVAASIDALAGCKQTWPACRGFWFDYLQSGDVAVGQLMQLCGQMPATTLVIGCSDVNALVLLLHPITTLQGKQLSHGQLVQVPFNRLRPVPATSHVLTPSFQQTA